MARIGKRLGAGASGAGTGSYVTAYTCPAGRRGFVTQVHFSNTGAADQLASAMIDIGSSAYNLLGTKTIPAFDYEDLLASPGFVINAGESLKVACNNTTAYVAFGYEEVVD